MKCITFLVIDRHDEVFLCRFGALLESSSTFAKILSAFLQTISTNRKNTSDCLQKPNLILSSSLRTFAHAGETQIYQSRKDLEKKESLREMHRNVLDVK